MKYTYNRPFLYEKQRLIVDDPHRHTLAFASTKSGKTVSHIIWLYEQALQAKPGKNLWWTAPTFTTTDIAYERFLRYIPKPLREPNGSKHIIRVFNDTNIFFKSADNPDNLYGDDVVAVVGDEVTRMKEQAWHAIRTVVTATNGKVKFICNHKGVDNWVIQLRNKLIEQKNDQWGFHTITALDAVAGGVFSMQEMEQARAELPEEIFEELYMAQPFDDRGKPFMWGFDIKRNTCDEYKITPELPVYLSFDFNVDPITAAVHQHAPNHSWIRTALEFRLPNSDINDLCDRIISELGAGSFNFIINGDASGRNRSAMNKNINYYIIISQRLKVPLQYFNVPKTNPEVSNSRVLSNSLYSKHPDCKIVKTCKYLIDDLRFTQAKNDGGIDKSDSQRSHLLDQERYYHWANFSEFIKKYL